ncbi:hypothetical protein G9P44_004272 [Scheffersomyces stipitis]|nr:hypothetical protein G9P44_004272 [Scheffersomyces stipitis]
MATPHIAIKAAFGLLVVLFSTFFCYYANWYTDLLQLSLVDAGTNSLPISHYSHSEALVIFPKVYQHFTGNFSELYREQYGYDFVNNADVIQYSGNSSSLSHYTINQKYKQHPVAVFDANTESEKCSEMKNTHNLQISGYDELNLNLDSMAKQLLHQLEHDESFIELRGFFKDDIKTQLRKRVLSKHFFKFAGTSVWLEDHGVHFMISRVQYSSGGSKSSPTMSLTYAQVFNEKWKELKDVELIVPSRTPNSDEPMVYKSMKFPSFLPIPFYHNVNFQDGRFYGPEDPRLLLVKNSMGREEPLMVFNAFQRKIDQTTLSEEGQMNVTFGFYRSMFLCWPFQFQMGKADVEGVRNDATDHIIYNKIVELRRENTHRLGIQKNWSPFIDLTERGDHYDKHIYFVYRWANLEILKCKLTDFSKNGESQCSFVYKRDPKLSEDADVGALRGGTELIQVDIGGDKAWVGFPRAHLMKCGCGMNMYRPNLAVLVQHGHDYKISHISSFMSLDIPVSGWRVPEKKCTKYEADVLIPNGISYWEKHGDDDYLSLTLSVADDSVHVIQIKNLLQQVKDMTKTENSNLGYHENSIECAIKMSEDFCKKYGNEQKKLQIAQSRKTER